VQPDAAPEPPRGQLQASQQRHGRDVRIGERADVAQDDRVTTGARGKRGEALAGGRYAGVVDAGLHHPHPLSPHADETGRPGQTHRVPGKNILNRRR
jgi:hypothetical protein